MSTACATDGKEGIVITTTAEFLPNEDGSMIITRCAKTNLAAIDTFWAATGESVKLMEN